MTTRAKMGLEQKLKSWRKNQPLMYHKPPDPTQSSFFLLASSPLLDLTTPIPFLLQGISPKETEERIREFLDIVDQISREFRIYSFCLPSLPFIS